MGQFDEDDIYLVFNVLDDKKVFPGIIEVLWE
jgi:hypothetical protein